MPRTPVGVAALQGLRYLFAPAPVQLPQLRLGQPGVGGIPGQRHRVHLHHNQAAGEPGPGRSGSLAVLDVELEEGVHLISNMVGCDPDDIEIGMPVEVVFETVNDNITLPKFKKA